jgi:hypothetical protein
MAKQHDEAAALRFEARWKQALEQPELVEAPPVKIPLDLSPVAVLARLREIDPDVLGHSCEEVQRALGKIRGRFL